MGVRRAMEMVLAEVNKGKGGLLTFGPLIHNNQVLGLLASKGVKPIEDIKGLQDGTIAIRAHGVSPDKRRAIKDSGLKIIDATCPRVARVQAIIRSYSRKGYSAIIVGDKDHPEVVGLMGYGLDHVYVINDPDDVSRLPHLDRPFVVAQTTQNEEKYREVVGVLRERFPDVLVFETICEATHDRQREVRSFADHVDAVVVVGGYHSGNTRRLAQVAREAGLPTFHVETEKDLDKKTLSGMNTVGVTAGASTPNWMIKKVVGKIEGIRGRKEAALFRWTSHTLKFLVLSNLLGAAGAFFFAHAASVLSETNPGWAFPFLAFLYVFAMHVLNRFLDKGASAYNDPERAAFLRRHKRMLVFASITAVAGALALSYSIGVATFLALCGLSFLGIVYSIPVVPKRIRNRFPYAKIKDIPGSRSLSEALAWTAVIGVLPLLAIDRIIWPAAILSSLVVFLMSYTRSAIFDIFQVQGDLIVGTETLPIIIGKKRTTALLKFIVLTTGTVLVAGAILRVVGPFSYVILIPLFLLCFCLLAHERRWLYPSLRFEALVEGTFFVAGFVALIWQAL